MADTGGAGGGVGKRRALAGGIAGLADTAVPSPGQEVFLPLRPGSGKAERRPSSGPHPLPAHPLQPAGEASAASGALGFPLPSWAGLCLSPFPTVWLTIVPLVSLFQSEAKETGAKGSRGG